MPQINTDNIMKLMDIFYGKIRHHNELGEIFNNAIGEDDERWEAHKKKIGNFWRGMLLGEGDYSGSPLKTHLELPPFPIERFDAWLALFEESLKQVFDEQDTQIILQRAQMIAQRFKMMLYEVPHQ